jgi:hypothetical protein
MKRLMSTVVLVLVAVVACALPPALFLATGQALHAFGWALLAAVVAAAVWVAAVGWSQSNLRLRSGAYVGFLSLLVVVLTYGFGAGTEQPWQISLLFVGASVAYAGIYALASGAFVAWLVQKALPTPRPNQSFKRTPDGAA